jgi:hypothetical protein
MKEVCFFLVKRVLILLTVIKKTIYHLLVTVNFLRYSFQMNNKNNSISKTVITYFLYFLILRLETPK